jgi:hypothetical protein
MYLIFNCIVRLHVVLKVNITLIHLSFINSNFGIGPTNVKVYTPLCAIKLSMYSPGQAARNARRSGSQDF